MAITSSAMKGLSFNIVILLLKIYPKKIPVEKENTIYVYIYLAAACLQWKIKKQTKMLMYTEIIIRWRTTYPWHSQV